MTIITEDAVKAIVARIPRDIPSGKIFGWNPVYNWANNAPPDDKVTAIVVSSDAYVLLLGDETFTAFFEPAVHHSDLRCGYLGSVGDYKILTDAFLHPIEQVQGEERYWVAHISERSVHKFGFRVWPT